jgi:tetraacyldisaccharide 4'-kinase
MNPLASLYGLAVRTRNALYERQALRVGRLLGPVISVGNLSVGGAGKTPFTILLGEQLKARGVPFDILSRGYGRQTRGISLADPNGTAKDFGDEPVLMARRLQVPVIVGEDRYQAGLFAEEQFGAQFHILDDGFQHRRLHRDFDIVLVTPEDARDRLLPVGRLREPLSSLSRANVVALTSGASPGSFPSAGATLWRVRRGIVANHVAPGPVAFCGIARPQGFFRQLRTAGIEPAAEAIFRDHHRYCERDIDDLLNLRRASEGEGFITTEKDAINLGPHLGALQPLTIVGVKMELSDAANAVDTMLRIIEERRRAS